MKPKTIKIRKVLSSRKNPRWNYAHFVNFFNGSKERLEPCCLKSKPCWECKR